ncbi:hypothetical protein CGLO_16481 [Colletotrichum gloeosporioides Cg-14]|uniref:Uncharacterized protein n=1 Tax=Colletotrichum gloeosporioides (strain Cg-14) TaxID=1237896 RepID=T0JNF9_COLGC|nr:hypothetical protein CGLO_16481 [Colletotrichum gloeosporioides Cg-14]
MSVELRCHEKLLWACAGEKGSVTFQLGKHPIDKFSIQTSNKPQMIIASPETMNDDCVLTIDYLIRDALEAMLAKRPVIDPDIAMAIHKAIQRMSRRLSSRLWIDPERVASKWSSAFRPYRTTGDFDNVGGLESVLHVLGIKPNQTQSTETFPPAGTVIAILLVFLIGTNVTVFFAISVASDPAASETTTGATTRTPNDEGAIIKSASIFDAGIPI